MKIILLKILEKLLIALVAVIGGITVSTIFILSAFFNFLGAF